MSTATVTRPYFVPLETSKTDQLFLAYHEANPQVFTRLVEMARQGKARGRTKIGIGMLVEVLRWERMTMASDPNLDFKISNNYKPRYARLIMDECPDLDGIFDLKTLWT